MSAGLIWHCQASKRAWHCSASSAAACSRWSSSTYDGYCRDLWCMWCMHQPGVTNALTNHQIIFCNTRVFLYCAEFLAIWTSFCLLGKDPIQDIQLQKHNFTWSSRSWFVGICMIFRNRVCVCEKYVNITSEKYIYVHKYVCICVYTYLCKAPVSCHLVIKLDAVLSHAILS